MVGNFLKAHMMSLYLNGGNDMFFRVKNIWGLVFIQTFFLVGIASACITIDAEFILEVSDLKGDTFKLERLCTSQNCLIETSTKEGVTFKKITIRSHYDKRVSLKLFGASHVSGISIEIKLPYILDEKGKPLVSEINPKLYNWKESVIKDLTFLKQIDVCDIQDSEIKKLSNLANSGRNIEYCGNQWRVLKLGEICVEGEIYQSQCVGGAGENTVLPLKELLPQ